MIFHRKPRSDIGSWLLTVASFIGAAYFLNPFDLYETWRSSKGWTPTPATVYEVEEVPRSAMGLWALKPHYRIFYQYRVDGKNYKSMYRHTDERAPRERDSITVRVNPDQPKQSIHGQGDFRRDAFLGVFCLFAGLWFLWKGLTDARWRSDYGDRY